MKKVVFYMALSLVLKYILAKTSVEKKMDTGIRVVSVNGILMP